MAILVVVADAGRARFFTADSPTAALVEDEDRLHPEGRLHVSEMASDEPGRTFESHGDGQHAMGNKVDPKRQEAIRFAKLLCDDMEARRNKGRVDGVYVVAPPQFLGELRDHMSDPLRQLVKDEIHKDLTEHGAADIRGHLPEHL
ncbi:MAG TPA: host attachment protein [Thioalkalivibrio sp.]|nr:host attachment protein [Thioalkalivibrio sp.]